MRARWQLAPVALALLISGTAAAGEWPRREILGSGDAVPSLGRIGGFSGVARGIDAGGRILIAADLSDGSAGLYWADESGLAAALVPLPDFEPRPRTAVVSPQGRVAVLAVTADVGEPPPAAIALVEDGTPRIILRQGDAIGDRFRIVEIKRLLAVGDDGTVLCWATVGPAASDPRGVWVLVAASPAGTRIVAGSDPSVDAERRFNDVVWIGVTAGGAVAFKGSNGGAEGTIYLEDARGLVAAVVPGEELPSGGRLREATAFAVSPRGELLLRGCAQTGAEYPRRKDCAVYRTEAGRLRRVVGPDARTPDGSLFTAFLGALNDTGDVLLSAAWLSPCGGGDPGLCEKGYGDLFLPAAGGMALVGRNLPDTYLSAAGDVAVPQEQGIARWRAGATTTLATADSAVPGGAALLAGGLDADRWRPPVCLATDGRVGAFVATTGGPALVCADAAGVHVVARAGAAPFADWSWSFWPNEQCAFADGDAMYVGGSDGIYRATSAAGIEPVIRAGDAWPGSTEPLVGRFGEYHTTDQVFSVNRHGTVAALYRGEDVLLRRPGGPIERVDLTRVDGSSDIAEIFEVEVADDESVLATVQQWNDREWPVGPATRVLRTAPDGARVIARRGPARPHPKPSILIGAPQNLTVAGRMASFSADDYQPLPLLYDLGSGVLHELLDGPYLPARAYVIGVADNGDALLDADHYGYGRFYFDGATLQRLSHSDALADRELQPVALGAPQTVLFQERQHGRQSLSVSGPPPSGRCPRIDLAATPSPTPSPTPRPTSHSDDGGGGCAVAPAHPDGWLLATLAALLVLRRVARR
jgi:hypothetical protein